jgi:hypothetical protein
MPFDPIRGFRREQGIYAGASNTPGALISPKITATRDNLKADIAANGGSPTIPYEAATKLRTAVGNSID